MKVNFEFNFEELDNNELRINGRRTDSYGVAMWDSIIIKKEWIFWIITTLRNLTYEDYNTWQRRIRNDYEDCRLIIRIFLRENDYSFIKIFPLLKRIEIRAVGLSDGRVQIFPKAFLFNQNFCRRNRRVDKTTLS